MLTYRALGGPGTLVNVISTTEVGSTVSDVIGASDMPRQPIYIVRSHRFGETADRWATMKILEIGHTLCALRIVVAC